MGGQGWAGQLTEENAKVLTQQYMDKYLNGYTVEQVLPFVGMEMTMYQAELKGPNGETRILYINPWDALFLVFLFLTERPIRDRGLRAGLCR